MASINGEQVAKSVLGGEVVQNYATGVMARLEDLVTRMDERLHPVLLDGAPIPQDKDPKGTPNLSPLLHEMYAKLSRMDDALNLANRILDRIDV